MGLSQKFNALTFSLLSFIGMDGFNLINWRISRLLQMKPQWLWDYPDSKVHGANVGPTWGRQDPDGPHVGPMNFAIWEAVPFPSISQVFHNMCSEVTLIKLLPHLPGTNESTWGWVMHFIRNKFPCRIPFNISMSKCKEDGTPVREPWSYIFLPLTHQFILSRIWATLFLLVNIACP